jgi:hypothetical protein
MTTGLSWKGSSQRGSPLTPSELEVIAISRKKNLLRAVLMAYSAFG